MRAQPGILPDPPRMARFITFAVKPDTDPKAALRALASRPTSPGLVVGLGAPLVQALGAAVEGLRPFPHLVGAGIEIPATPAALWCWLRGDDRGDLLHTGRELAAVLEAAFDVSEVTDGFQYREGRDLTGYEDGTENPKGDDAVNAAFVGGAGAGLDGSSFVAVQRWVHELARFDGMSTAEQDNVIGRRRADNEELGDAPPSAHVKRAAQESFEPPAFVLRRSMPWADGREHGLVFVAFGRSLDAFEALLRRMVGLDDGVADGLFRFTHPVTGSYFWCPPVADGRLDLSAVGL